MYCKILSSIDPRFTVHLGGNEIGTLYPIYDIELHGKSNLGLQLPHVVSLQ